MKYIKGFDGLRCFSVILVIITHTGIKNSLPESDYVRNNVFYFFSGAAGVNIFFAISGFLITSLLLHEKSLNGKIDLRKFFARRFLRLLPPIIPFFIAVFIFMILGYIRPAYAGLAAAIFYVSNFIPKAKFAYSPESAHTWSLSVEEQFYLFWAIIINRIRVYRVYIISGIIICLCLIFNYLLPVIPIRINGKDYLFEDIFFTQKWTVPAVAPIFIGAILALMNYENKWNIKDKFRQKKYGFISLIIFLSPFYLPDFLLPTLRFFHGLGASLILIWIYHNQNGAIVSFLEWKPIKYIGVISYGLYIWQGFFVRTGPAIEPKIWLHELPYNIPLSFVVAILSYELYEKKILKYKTKYIVNYKN
jgi:peptidoglycan/LPS O-acetylase OafA/YrhL